MLTIRTTREITPSVAAAWLYASRHHLQSRAPNRNTVDAYAAAMAEGRWLENRGSIRLAGEIVLDGWHRLLACVASGASFRTRVDRELGVGNSAGIEGAAARSGAAPDPSLSERGDATCAKR